MKLKLITDSNCDLPHEYFKENQIEVIPFHYSIDGTDYVDDFGKTLSYSEFYKKLRSGLMATTTLIPPSVFEIEFLKCIKEGFSVVCISFSSALSSSYNSAYLARKSILESHPDADIAIIDSRQASSGQGLLIHKAVSFLKEGKTFGEMIELLEEEKKKIRTIFTVDSLEHLRRGGRLSVTSAAFGYLLEVKPILEINEIGALVPFGKVRGRKKSINFLFDSVVEEIDESLDLTIFINHADCYAEAADLRDRVKMRLKSSNIFLNDLGPVIGSHSGPGTLVISYIRKKSIDNEKQG